ncbi:hypothetical protein Acr_00g0007680 [Actinidia rufa]|uniref:Uncharacterized protein n=1 Tax=Actinidia rufa TaxID=165716 RepID=A0A7J0D8E7_9ERIC|nr:hypothetical protein Acr_00g0007680 [Actinidia rufa]
MGEVGSEESENSEGEEIFEEAIEADTLRVYSVDNLMIMLLSAKTIMLRRLGIWVDKLPAGFEDKVALVDEAAVKEVIDEESVAEKDLRDGLNQMENDVAWEASNITTSGGKEDLKIEDETDQKLGGITSKCENSTSDIVNLEERSGGDSDSQQEVDSIGESLHQSGRSEEVKPTMGLFDTGHQDYKSCEHEDVVASELHTDNVEGAKDNLVNLDTELKDDEIRELKEEAPVSPVLLYRNGKNEELKDMSNVNLENQDERSCELECTSAATDSDHHRISLKREDTQHMPLEGSKATLQVSKLSRSEDSVRETGEKSQASGSKKIEGAQLQQADKDAEASNVAA